VYPVHAPLKSLGYLFVGWIAAVLCVEFILGSYHLADLIPGVNRHPDRAGLVRDGPLNSLPYPPGGVGGKPEALVWVELLDALHKAYVALLDEVLEGEPVSPVPLGHRDYKLEVLLDQLLACSFIPGLGTSTEGNLFSVGQEVAPTDARKIVWEKFGYFFGPIFSLRLFGFGNHLAALQYSWLTAP
jgi:hypothetical protein